MVTADPSISSAAVTRVKQLLLLGKRDDAIALYAEEAHCERATATATVNEYAVDDMWSVMGRLNAAGMVIATGFVMLLASSIALGITGGVSWTTAAWMGGPAAAFIVFEGSRFLRTLHYFFARAGAATVVRFALIGKNAGNDALFRLLLEVREPQGSTFRTEINCVLGDEDAAAMKEGYRVRVRYFRGDPTSVLYK